MYWRTKARIQKAVSLFPSPVSYGLYYWMQRHLGGLKNVDPVQDIQKGIELCKRIREHKRPVAGKVFLEIGTGRRINVPVALWLMGAEKIITVDLNEYLKEELVQQDINYLSANRGQIAALFDEVGFEENRFDKLLEMDKSSWCLDDLTNLCNIEYIAPGDAASIPSNKNSVDYQVSVEVLEHIPEDGLRKIIKRAQFIVREGGLCIHKIDFSDHFSHSDSSISAINFLKYSDEEWDDIAGNRYMYMNRMRLDDFIDLYREAGQKILSIQSEQDKPAYELLLDGGIRVERKFGKKAKDILSVRSSWIVSENCC